MPFFVRLRLLLFIVGLSFLCYREKLGVTAASHENASSPPNHRSCTSNPYHILGISPQSCDDTQIKKRYRELCLKYHPDKNRNSQHSKEYEHLFKQVQWAYEQIATAEARRTFQQKQWFEQQQQRQHQTTRHNDPQQPHNFYRTSHVPEDDILREAFANAFRHYSTTSSSSFYPGGFYRGRDFFGFDVHPLFRFTCISSSSSSFQSIYTQTIDVPLSDMYVGRSSMKVHLHDHFLARLRAAFRSGGGMGYLIVYQAILMALPMLRVSKWVALGWALFCLERFLPRQYIREQYDIKIEPGYKSGTKLVFEDEHGTGSHGVQVQFVLKEKSHPIYTRVGNDLHVSCVLCPCDARDGCQLQIPSLADEEILLSIQIPKHSKSGDKIRLTGQGWPNRKKTGPSYGDLVVTVMVSRLTSKSKILQRGQSWDFITTFFHLMRKATSQLFDAH